MALQTAMQANILGSGQQTAEPALPQMATMHGPQVSQAPVAPQFTLSPDIIAAIAMAMGQNSVIPAQARQVQPSGRKYFLHAITNATSDLPIAVIKEL